MQHSTYEIHSKADGLKLCGFAWTPEKPPKAAVQIAHGLAEHSERYARFAEALTEAEFAVYAHDHRGHGRSIAAGGVPGDAGEPGWGGLVADVAQHHKRICNAHPSLPIFIIGHSMGSFAVQRFLFDHSQTIAGAILSGSTDIAVVAQMIAAGGEVPSLTSYNAAFEPARTPFDWLSRDEAEVDAYIIDPLCGFDAPESFAMSMMQGAGELGNTHQLNAIHNDLPLLVIAGDADPLNAGLMMLNSLVGKYEAAGLTSVETKYYKGARHEILNETNRDEVTADILEWLKEQCE